MTHPVLLVDGLKKAFGKTVALDGIDIVLAPGAFTVLLGAAGAGKTTTLRSIAGLEVPDAGRVVIRGQDATRLEPKDRDVAMIFDSLALYPNKTGFENIAHPLRVRRQTKSEIEAKVQDIAEILKIEPILHRLPKTMSGGERQRIALGRALVRDPAFFLLDEPLASLDAMLRVELRTELKRLQRENGHAFLYATPDFTEALAVADQVFLLVEGQVRQIAAPQTLYDQPADRDVARFVGAPEINLLRAEYDPSDGGRVRVADMVVRAPTTLNTAFNGTARSFEAGLRPEHIALKVGNGGESGGEIVDIEPLGLYSAITLTVSGMTLRATMPTADALHFPVGTPVGLDPMADKMLAFDPKTGRRLH